MKRPSFQFYPGDFFRDPGVRAISFAARGLWTDMLCLMHESDRRGYLQLNGKPVNAEQLARMTGGSTDEVSRLLQELDDSGVFSRTEHGVMYSRRMVRDERKRELCADAGKRGGGNPTFKGHPKGVPKGRDKGQPKASSSASSSTSFVASATNTPLPPGGDFVDAVERDEPDWLIVEAEFIARWNALDGVAIHNRNSFEGTNLVLPFRRAWRENGWIERATAAMAKFPLQNGVKMGIRKFLEPTTIDEILGGIHDFTKGGSSGKRGGGTDATRVRNERTDGDFANIPVVHGVAGQPP